MAMMSVMDMLARRPDVVYGVLAMNTTRHWVEPAVLGDCYGTLPHWWAPVDNRITLVGAIKNFVNRTPYHISRFWSDSFAEVFQNALAEFRPDLVLLEGLPLLEYLPLIRARSKAAIVYDAHNVEHLIWTRLADAEPNPLRRYYLREQVRRLKQYETSVLIGGKLDGVITLTENDAATIRGIGYHGLLHVKPFALPLEQYTPVYAPEEAPTLFHLGPLSWAPNRQGIEWFLAEVFPLVRIKVPWAEFYVAGHIPQSVRISSSDGVHVLGPVPDAKEFMSQRSILVVPLRAGSGVRVKIIEAMALGKAVVATSIGAEGIACSPGQDLLIADTAEDFATALSSLLLDPRRVEMIGRNARRYVEQYHDQQCVGNQLAAFLATVVDYRRSTAA